MQMNKLSLNLAMQANGEHHHHHLTIIIIIVIIKYVNQPVPVGLLHAHGEHHLVGLEQGTQTCSG